MTEQTTPDAAARDRKLAHEWATRILSDMRWSDRAHADARVLHNATPPLSLKTLADMTPEERAACQWMQCDVEGDGGWLIIEPFDDEDYSHVVGHQGNIRFFPADIITPRPDLPRMEWTDNHVDTISDTVPPNTLVVGSVWGDPDALARACHDSGRDQIVVLDSSGNAYVWAYDAEWWEGSLSVSAFTSYTILHTGRKADQ